MKIERTSQGEVTSVGKRGDDKTWRTPQVFITIFKHCIAVADQAGVPIIIPLITQLPAEKTGVMETFSQSLSKIKFNFIRQQKNFHLCGEA